MSAAAAPIVSICVCTYRRPQGLKRLLDSLKALMLPPELTVELVVVDNHAEGSARDVFETHVQGWGRPARYVVESRSGVGHARSRCVAEARGEWIAFIDDDEWAEPQWLALLWGQRQQRDADGVFGPVIASFEQEPPEWLVASGAYRRARHPSGMRMGWPDCASGNVLFRRQLFFDVGGFDPAFAESGSEDSDFFWRCLSSGAVFVWCDEAIAHEGVPPQRMTREYLNKRAFIAGQNYARLHGHREGRPAYVRFAVRGFFIVLLFAPLVWGARLLRRPETVRYEGKLKGGLGKIQAGWAPVSREYGASSSKPTDSRG
jgi:glycosyltransferase involved in cell wall biosynthesis